ncbi:unnamed protein product [Lupinus luteus]|uniref:Uncharacterized protein n=1 Tax=Lupinus luteus TaxID=3873 RepID=A0AAV1Y358_LUPLU
MEISNVLGEFGTRSLDTLLDNGITYNQLEMIIIRLLVRTQVKTRIEETISASIDGLCFDITIWEEIGGVNGVSLLNKSSRCEASGLISLEDDSSSFESSAWVSDSMTLDSPSEQLVDEGAVGLEEREDDGGVNARRFTRLGELKPAVMENNEEGTNFLEVNDGVEVGVATNGKLQIGEFEEVMVGDPCREKLCKIDATSFSGPHVVLKSNEGDHVVHDICMVCNIKSGGLCSHVISCNSVEIELSLMHVSNVEAGTVFLGVDPEQCDKLRLREGSLEVHSESSSASQDGKDVGESLFPVPIASAVVPVEDGRMEYEGKPTNMEVSNSGTSEFIEGTSSPVDEQNSHLQEALVAWEIGPEGVYGDM